AALWRLATPGTPTEDSLTICEGGFGQTFQPAERSSAGERQWTQSNIRFSGAMGIDATRPFIYKDAFERARYNGEVVDLAKFYSPDQTQSAKPGARDTASSPAARGLYSSSGPPAPAVRRRRVADRANGSGRAAPEQDRQQVVTVARWIGTARVFHGAAHDRGATRRSPPDREYPEKSSIGVEGCLDATVGDGALSLTAGRGGGGHPRRRRERGGRGRLLEQRH